MIFFLSLMIAVAISETLLPKYKQQNKKKMKKSNLSHYPPIFKHQNNK